MTKSKKTAAHVGPPATAQEPPAADDVGRARMAAALALAEEHAVYLADRIAIEAYNERKLYDVMVRHARAVRHDPARLAPLIRQDVVLPQSKVINEWRVADGEPAFHFSDRSLNDATEQLVGRIVDDFAEGAALQPLPERAPKRRPRIPAAPPPAAPGPRGKSRTYTLDEDVADVLRRASVRDNAVSLPPERLDRGLYERVAEALESAGAVWSRRAQAHVFKRDDARESFVSMLARGAYTVSNDIAFFETPPDIAERVARLAGARPGARILEPSGGKGSIVRACVDLGATVVAVEYHEGRAGYLAEHFPGVRVVRGDFLALSPEDLGAPFDGVAMNPPFALEGQQIADVEHVEQALKFLRPGAMLAAVMPSSARTSATAARRRFREAVEARGAKWEDLPSGAFAESGTNISTVILSTRA